MVRTVLAYDLLHTNVYFYYCLVHIYYHEFSHCVCFAPPAEWCVLSLGAALHAVLSCLKSLLHSLHTRNFIIICLQTAAAPLLSTHTSHCLMRHGFWCRWFSLASQISPSSSEHNFYLRSCCFSSLHYRLGSHPWLSQKHHEAPFQVIIDNRPAALLLGFYWYTEYTMFSRLFSACGWPPCDVLLCMWHLQKLYLEVLAC